MSENRKVFFALTNEKYRARKVGLPPPPALTNSPNEVGCVFPPLFGGDTHIDLHFNEVFLLLFLPPLCRPLWFAVSSVFTGKDRTCNLLFWAGGTVGDSAGE